MFDTMTITKIGGGVLGAWLLLLLGGWAAQGIYSTEASHGEDHVPGYSIALPDTDAPAEEVIEVAFADVYATADAAAGERLWRQCSACHANVAGQNGVGPYLHGIVDRPKAAVDGFNYSDALLAMADQAWTPEALSEFLERPSNYAPGTAMSYNGMSDVEDRANLIAYLDTFDD